MAEVAACTIPSTFHGSGLSASVDYGSMSKTVGSTIAGKRKTPSELRLEQLKRVHTDYDEAGPAATSSDGNPKVPRSSAPQKETSRPRFVDTRVPDIYAATRPGDRPKLFAKDKQKDAPVFPQKNDEPTAMDTGVTSVSFRSKSLAKFQWKKAEEPIHLDTSTGSEASNLEIRNTRTDSLSFNTFKDVTQISSGLQGSSSGPTLDMVKAFKGMAAPKVSKVVGQTVATAAFSKTPNSSLAAKSNIQVKLPPFCVQGEKLPLDLSLKTSMRFTSSASFQRFQKISNRNQCVGLQSFLGVLGCQGNIDMKLNTNITDCVMGQINVEASFSKALHSWVHPQAVLPSSVLSALASAAAHGGVTEKDFLSKRQKMWEDSFRSLYYMFRNGQCELFYFSTQQFLVMFIGGDIGGRDKKACRAYLTRSTRGLRGLLQEQDIAFSMPLCTTEADTTTMEEIQELTEFEKAHPGQTRLVDAMIALDNSPQSVLAFSGHRSVHGLYDFLLNHRCLLASTTGADVPVLYSPVSFENAALVIPEVICKQLQRASETIQNQEQSEDTDRQASSGSLNLSFCLDLKGTILPPWVVWRVCGAVQQLQPGNFEASFATEPLSGCLNIAQEVEHRAYSQLMETSDDTVLEKKLKKLEYSPGISMGFIKHLKFKEGSYTATVASV